MQTRTKIVLFLLGFCVVFVAGLCFGKSGLFAGGGILGAIGAAIFGRTIKKGSTRAADVARENARAAASIASKELDRVLSAGEGLRREGESLYASGRQLRDEGDSLVEAGERLLAESKGHES